MTTIHYLAYGSNLHPGRLQARIPSARLCAVAELAAHRLSFDKRGQDRSGKCTIGPHSDLSLYAAIYTLEAADKPTLDRIEGEGYVQQQLGPVVVAGKRYLPFAYIARPDHCESGLRPFDWYRDLVLAGALYHGFPSAYVAAIRNTPAMPDPDLDRRRRHLRLLRELNG